MRIPRAITSLIESFEKLPGVGPKTAQRLTFYLLHVPQGELDRFASPLQGLRIGTVLCSICYSVGEMNPCEICTDRKRDGSLICVVEQPLDVLALERSGKYMGLYHVLHGKIDPLNNIGPDEIYIGPLLKRIKNGVASESNSAQANAISPNDGTSNVPLSRYISVKEVVLATNPTMEGEATAMYISKQLKGISGELRVTRIGRGLPTGADLEYADPTTLMRAMEGRSNF